MMLEDEVVTLSEDSENENAISSDPNIRQNATLAQQKLDEQENEMQKLRDRVEELEQQVTSLQSLSSNKCDCSSVSKDKIESTSKTPSVEKCLEVIKAQEEKIGLLIHKIKDWGLDEEKIYEIPKKKKAKTVLKEEKKDYSKPSPRSNYNSEEDMSPVKRRSHGTKTEENKFDWAKIPSRPHDVTSSDKLRKVGRKFNTRRSLTPLLKNTFSSRTVSSRIKDIPDGEEENKDDEECEEYFVYKKSPVVKIRKLKRMSLPNFKLDLD